MARKSSRISLATVCALGVAFLGLTASAEARSAHRGLAGGITPGLESAMQGMPARSSGQAHAPWITTKGTQFIDTRTGQPVSLHGVNAMLGGPSEYSQVPQIHANVVRLFVSWDWLEPKAPVDGMHQWNTNALQALDAEILWFRQKHISVILDPHQGGWSSYFTKGGVGIPAWYYSDGSYSTDQLPQAEAAFWTTDAARSSAAYSAFVTMLVARYRAYPNVIGYELFNEPPPGAHGNNPAGVAAVFRWEAGIRQAILSVDRTRAVFVSCTGGGDYEALWSDFSAFGGLSHVVFDFHDYWKGPDWKGPNTPTYSDTLADQLAYLAPILSMTTQKKIPLFIGEWGVPNATANGAQYQAQMLKLFKLDGIGSARWFMWPSNDSGGLTLLALDNTFTPLATQLAQAWAGS